MSSLPPLRQALENALRSWTTTIPTVLVIALVLTMFHGLLSLHAQAQDMLRSVAKNFSFTVYLKDSADALEIANLKLALEQRSDVVPPVTYTSRESASEAAKKMFGLEPSLLQNNNFSLPASITITPQNPEDSYAIEAFLKEEAAALIQDPLAGQEPQKSLTRQMIAF
ncbi:hypothetical protein HYV58_00325, partial [Candidatus Peregrinibacteria bacterium]|nr:hypothetical protein [Candidatus Peregrinibacteria bacterium]